VHCNPAAGKECGEATPDNAPYRSVAEVLVAESRVQSAEALSFLCKRNGTDLSDVVGKVSKQ